VKPEKNKKRITDRDPDPEVAESLPESPFLRSFVLRPALSSRGEPSNPNNVETRIKERNERSKKYVRPDRSFNFQRQLSFDDDHKKREKEERRKKEELERKQKQEQERQAEEARWKDDMKKDSEKEKN